MRIFLSYLGTVSAALSPHKSAHIRLMWQVCNEAISIVVCEARSTDASGGLHYSISVEMILTSSPSYRLTVKTTHLCVRDKHVCSLPGSARAVSSLYQRSQYHRRLPSPPVLEVSEAVLAWFDVDPSWYGLLRVA